MKLTNISHIPQRITMLYPHKIHCDPFLLYTETIETENFSFIKMMVSFIFSHKDENI